MTIISHDDISGGVPRIDGFDATVIEIYASHARHGMEPAEVADEYGVPLARVHEAIAYYYDHSERMRELEDWDEIAPASADREDWDETTPDDAGESLFGNFDDDDETETNPFNGIGPDDET